MSKLTKNRKLVLSKIEPNKVYKLGEAAALLKEITFTQFDASVDLDGRLLARHFPLEIGVLSEKTTLIIPN